MKAVPEGFPDKRIYTKAFTLPSYAARVMFSQNLTYVRNEKVSE